MPNIVALAVQNTSTEVEIRSPFAEYNIVMYTVFDEQINDPTSKIVSQYS